MAVMGITRIANITGLDHIGLPVVMVCRPNSRSLSVAQGKGVDLASAQASGVMEAVESFHAERITLPLKLASYEELRYTHRVVEVSGLPADAAGAFHPETPIHWIEGYDLLHDEPVWVPDELAHLNFTVGMPASGEGFLASSNGLASGNHHLEALSHGICEVIERDAATLWRLRPAEARARTRVDLATVTEPLCRAVLDKYERASVGVAVWDMTSDVGAPTFLCRLYDESGDVVRRLPVAEGQGCHPQREIALLRALTEAAQGRLTYIAGSRDDCLPVEYERLRDADLWEQHRAEWLAVRPTRPFTASPTWHAETFNEDAAWELDCLQAAGIQRVIVVDLTRPEFGLPVVRVIIPGLEALSGGSSYVPGRRARARAARP
ncbi:MAG: YcaO-like family protein [Anaerolineae bacterium]|nr:YcaO-like family protein [Anaerolineae bacterium]